MSIHIYHTLFQTVERNLVCSKFCRLVQSMYNFRLEIADTLDILNMLHATQDQAPLEGYIGPKFVPHNQRNESNFVFLLEKEKNIVIN